MPDLNGASEHADEVGRPGGAPDNFTNTSPFPPRKELHDPVRVAAIVAATIAFLTFVGSMVAVLKMRPPI